MKTLLLNCLLIVILLVSCSSPSDSYTPEQSKIIGTPINIGNFEVAQNDFPKIMMWEDAVKACADLGNGWRLPTKDELNLMYRDKYKISRFANNLYWSSTKERSKKNVEYAWAQQFSDGAGGRQERYEINYFLCINRVRAVRSF